MNRLLVALAFAAAVPSVGFRMTGCDGYYDGSSVPRLTVHGLSLGLTVDGRRVDGGPAIITSLVLMERSICGLRAVLTKRRFSIPSL